MFEWDDARNSANITKHEIDFEDAIGIFESSVLIRTDDRRDYGEVRVVAVGVVDNPELAVVYTVRGTRRRIISARRTKISERKAYREAYPE
jgi:uncharacterized DUF497 family protein